ncbi:unnamed protein product [Ectocarpus sp. 4 AP-2014]
MYTGLSSALLAPRFRGLSRELVGWPAFAEPPPPLVLQDDALRNTEVAAAAAAAAEREHSLSLVPVAACPSAGRIERHGHLRQVRQGVGGEVIHGVGGGGVGGVGGGGLEARRRHLFPLRLLRGLNTLAVAPPAAGGAAYCCHLRQVREGVSGELILQGRERHC